MTLKMKKSGKMPKMSGIFPKRFYSLKKRSSERRPLDKFGRPAGAEAGGRGRGLLY